MRDEHRCLPLSINVDKNAAYSQAERVVLYDCKLRRIKYSNNIIQQDPRAVRRKRRAAQCFRTFHGAERTMIEGVYAMRMFHKGQVNKLDGTGAMVQAQFVASLFGVAA